MDFSLYPVQTSDCMDFRASQLFTVQLLELPSPLDGQAFRGLEEKKKKAVLLLPQAHVHYASLSKCTSGVALLSFKW